MPEMVWALVSVRICCAGTAMDGVSLLTRVMAMVRLVVLVPPTPALLPSLT